MTSKTPKKRDADATRRRILEVATRTFVELGFEGARVDAIAVEAGVSKRMLYVHFGNKEALYQTVLDRQLDLLLHLRNPAEARATDPIQEGREIIRRYFWFLAENPNFVRLVNWEAVGGKPAMQHVLFGKLAQALSALREIIEEGMRQGRLREDLDPRRFILNVNALCLGQFRLQPIVEAAWNRDLSSMDALEETLRQLLDLVFEGALSASEAPSYRAEI